MLSATQFHSEPNLFGNIGISKSRLSLKRSITILDKIECDENQCIDDIDNNSKSEIPSSFDHCGKQLLETMKYETNRLLSFENKWPCHFVKPSDLAEAGFFYLQSEDRAQCPFCFVIIYNWEDGDKPLREHMKKNPKCPFLMSIDVGNVPVVQQRSNNSKKTVNCDWTSSLASSNCRQKTSSAHTYYKPKHPRMSDVKRRLLSFKEWPLKTVKPQQLAECGLYYTGVSDVVTCFFCGGSLGNWEIDDDPWEEHSKHFGHCIFLSLAKNSFKRKSKTSTATSENSWGKQVFNSNQASNAETKSAVLAEIIQQASEIFPESLVLDVMLKYRTRCGKNVASLSELCEEIIKFKEKDSRLNSSEENLAKSSSETVPIDSSEAIGTSTTKNRKELFLCKICMDQEMEVVFQPCGHLVSCQKCSQIIADCPLCRKPIINTVRTYLS